MIWRALILAVGTLAYAAGATAQGTGLRRLTDRDDLLGWEAVGRLELNRQGFCTGTLIAPELVLTAAHCVYDRNGKLRPAEQIAFRAGLRDGVAVAERQGLQIAAHPGFNPRTGLGMENIRHDVALIRLAEPIPSSQADAFALHSGRDYGSGISVTSYGMGRAEALSRQRQCNLMGEHEDVLMIDCNVTFGSSGAPVFSFEGERPRIVSVVSAKARVEGSAVSLGASLADELALLEAQLTGAHVGSRMPQGVGRVQVGEPRRNDLGAKFISN
mgnify:CR=1 FL=1